MPSLPRTTRPLTALLVGLSAVVVLALVATVVVLLTRDDTPTTATGATTPATGLGEAELDAVTIPELQQRMDAGSLSSATLTSAYLARIADVGDDLGAVLAVNPDALAEATASDEHRADDGARSPLEGIPVLLKDNVAASGMPTTAGSRELATSEPADAALTAKLRAAGAVVLGKANLSEWANYRSTTATSGWSGVGGQTRNPYVLDRGPCGSSSGSAVGVAASLAQVAIGTETDGSIVCPAATDGVVGVKPTLGLVSRTGVVPISADQDTPGPIARHTVDAALTLQVLAGPDAADPATAEAPAGSGSDAGTLDTGALAGARIGVWTLTSAESAAVDDATEGVFADAVQHLRDAGAIPVPVQLASIDAISTAESTALLSEFHRDIDAYLAAAPGEHPADLAALIAADAADPVELAYFGQELFEQAEQTPTPDDDPAAARARATAQQLARASIDDALAQGPGTADDLTAIVSLTGTPAAPIEYQSLDGSPGEFVYSSSTPAAVAGYPAVTVPAGFAGPSSALPVGISFVGARWDDARLLDVAASFEAADPARRAPGYLPTVGEGS